MAVELGQFDKHFAKNTRKTGFFTQSLIMSGYGTIRLSNA